MIRCLFFSLLLFLGLTSLAYALLETIPCPPQYPNSTCGKISVPLDHANPSTTVHISMLYTITYPSNQANFDTALICVIGGAGMSLLPYGPIGLASLELVDKLERPVILVDPRGTGDASLLNCSLQSKPYSLDYNIFDIRRCLLEIGDEVLHYSTTAIVNDMEILRKALGFKQLDVVGLSYGTLVTQAYGVLYPESVRSMLLDSPVPMRFTDLYRLRRHSAYARIHTELNKDNPNFSTRKFKKNLQSILHRLRWNRALREDLKIDPRYLYHLYRSPSKLFGKAIASAATERNYAYLKEMARQFKPGVLPLRNFSIAAAISTACNSIVDLVPWSADSGPVERISTLVYDVLHKVDLKSFRPFYLTEGFQSVAMYCATMPFPQLRKEGLPLEKGRQKEIPALVLVGDLDPTTPMDDVVDLDPVLQNNVAVVKGAGHVVNAHPCGGRLLWEFLMNRTVENLSACQ